MIKNTKWSLRSNFIDIPTDCPHRERAGWTGDAIEIMPWTLYQTYGDKSILEEFYPNMKRWVDANEKRAMKRNIFNILKSGKHYRYILDTGYHWGEWLEPGDNSKLRTVKAMFHPDEEVATGYFAYAALITSRVARLLEKSEEEAHYNAIYEKVCNAYHKEFLKNGTSTSKRQCRYVRPVALELATIEETDRLMKSLDQLVRENQYKIGTGFLSTPHILRVLADHGYIDTAYRMLENRDIPGWLYQITKGATTIWENWYGINEKGVLNVSSQNHYSPGSVVAWLFDSVAGIRPIEPGFKNVRISPMPGGSLTWAKCSYKSVQGLIRSEWKMEENKFILEVEIPPDTTGEIYLPSGKVHKVSSGTYQFEDEMC